MPKPKEVKRQYLFAMDRAADGRRMARNLRSHGTIHPKVEGNVLVAIENAVGNKSGWYMPKVGKGKLAKKVQQVIYIREGPDVVLYETTGKIASYNPVPSHGKKLREFRKVNDVWVDATRYPLHRN